MLWSVVILHLNTQTENIETYVMPVPQYRSIGPVTINNCTDEELASLRGAVSREGSRVRCLIMHVDCDQQCGETGAGKPRTVRLTANGLERLSTLMWSKQLGIPRIQQLITPCTKGEEQAMDECRAQLDLDFESQEHLGTWNIRICRICKDITGFVRILQDLLDKFLAPWGTYPLKGVLILKTYPLRIS